MNIRSVVGRRLAFLPLALTLPWAVLAWAQGPDRRKGPERDRGAEEEEGRERDTDRSERMLEMLHKRLELSADQTGKVKSIIAEGKPQIEAIRKEMQALQEKVHKQIFAQTEKIRAVLSNDQKMKFDQIKMRIMQHQMHGDGMRHHRAKRGGPGPGRRFGPPDEEDEERGEHPDHPESPHHPEGD